MNDEELVEYVAREFHEVYESLAASWDWETQERSRVLWEDLPENQQGLMKETILLLRANGCIALSQPKEPKP